VVRQQARELAHQLLGGRIGLEAVLARPVLQHLEPRVVPALPVQHVISFSTARKIRLRVSTEAAASFQSVGRSPASAISVMRSSTPTALGSSSRELRIFGQLLYQSYLGLTPFFVLPKLLDCG
jgi:hypothetical protein